MPARTATTALLCIQNRSTWERGMQTTQLVDWFMPSIWHLHTLKPYLVAYAGCRSGLVNWLLQSNSTLFYFSMFKHSPFPVWHANLSFWIHLFFSLLGLHVELLQSVRRKRRRNAFTTLLMFPPMWRCFISVTLLASGCPLTHFLLKGCRDWGVWELGLGLHSPPLFCIFLLEVSCPSGSTCPVADSVSVAPEGWHGERLALCSSACDGWGGVLILGCRVRKPPCPDINHILQSQHYQS